MSSVTAVLNLHREGEMAIAAFKSAWNAIEKARQGGFQADLFVVLDRTDDETQAIIDNLKKKYSFRVDNAENGDLADSRNHAVRHSETKYIGFLDGDDLWCNTWLLNSIKFSEIHGEKTICHPAWNVVFGTKEMHFPHPDQLDDHVSLESLRFANYWSALSFSFRATYERFPYQRNRINEGFGYEDWAWNCETINAGFLHRAVPETTHFIRYKAKDSLRDKTTGEQCLRSPSNLFRRYPEQQHVNGTTSSKLESVSQSGATASS